MNSLRTTPKKDESESTYPENSIDAELKYCRSVNIRHKHRYRVALINENFLQEKAVEATKQEKERKEEKT
jgi:CTP synthase (UTP-ammonia lyase)